MAAALVTGILLIPTPLRVQGTLVLTVAKPTEIYAEVPGRLVSLNVKDGEHVKAKAVIATLSNPEKQLEYEQLLEQHDSSSVKAIWYRMSPSTRPLRVQALQMEKTLEETLTKVSEQIDKLTIVAPRDGQVIGVPHKSTLGQYLKTGKPLLEIGDPKKLEAHLILDQGDIDLIHSRNESVKPTAWVKIYGMSEKTFRSYVDEVAKKNRDEIPESLTTNTGGEIATKQDQKTGQAKPLNAVFEVIIPLNNEELLLQPGLRGFAKIDAGHSTLAWWIWRSVTKTFHFTL